MDISPLHKAGILMEALPYIKAFGGKRIVVKYGGHAMVDPDLKENFAKNMVLLKLIGVRPIVVHGGGPQDRQGPFADWGWSPASWTG